jgi:hypothetical protein
MRALKRITRQIYLTIRFLFFPLLWLFRPTGLRPESIVAISTVAVFIFVIQPIVAARLGAGYAVGTTGAGAVLAYLFLMWGKEFEHNSRLPYES